MLLLAFIFDAGVVSWIYRAAAILFGDRELICVGRFDLLEQRIDVRPHDEPEVGVAPRLRRDEGQELRLGALPCTRRPDEDDSH